MAAGSSPHRDLAEPLLAGDRLGSGRDSQDDAMAPRDDSSGEGADPPHRETPLPAPPPSHDVGPAEARRILRRIDRRLMPLLFGTYVFNFMDKTILSSAAVFGLREANGLEGSDYAWVSSAFYLDYLAWAWPASLLVARLPTARYAAANTLFWGAAVGSTAACSSFGGLFAARFLLGVAEATTSPALVFVTSTWYTRDEIPARTGIWFAGNSAGGVASSLLAYGVGHVGVGVGRDDDEVAGPGPWPWQWMFVILGVATFLWGFALLALLPDGIAGARFLTARERRWAEDRVVVAGLGRTAGAAAASWRRDQAAECLADPKAWLILGLALLCQLPNGGAQSFANLVVTSFGFTPLQSTLVNIPYSALGAAVIAGTGWLAGRSRSAGCALVALAVLPPVAGAALIGSRGGLPPGASLFGYFLLSTGPAALPLILSLVQSNFRGVTKKMTMTALLFIAYCAGNIAGPQFFKASEEPTYSTAFRAIMICYALVVVLALALRVYLQRANARQRREEGVRGDAASSGVLGGRQNKAGGAGGAEDEGDASGPEQEQQQSHVIRPEDYEDLTDWEAFGFRYRL